MFSKKFSGLFRIKICSGITQRTRSSVEICDALKLNLCRFQNKQINSNSVLQFQMRYRFISHLSRISVYSTPQSLFSCFFSHLRLAHVYKRVTDLCKLEQKRLLSGYLSALTRSPRRRPSRDEILPTLSVASLFVER